jgi:hypothetical protein
VFPLERFGKKIPSKFTRSTDPSTTFIHYVIKTGGSTLSLLDKKLGRKCRVLTEEKLDKIGENLASLGVGQAVPAGSRNVAVAS